VKSAVSTAGRSAANTVKAAAGKVAPAVGKLASTANSAAKTVASKVTGKPNLKALAEDIRTSGDNLQSITRRTIAVGQDKAGKLFAGSSNGFDKGMRAALTRLGITRVPGSGKLHAEEELLRGVPNLKRVGTSVRAPCGPAENNCAQQLKDANVEVEP